MSGTYVTDITHFLDDTGEIVADVPIEARQLASFITLLIEEASRAWPDSSCDSGIRCRGEACTGSIYVSLAAAEEEIVWHCPLCGHNGVIRNWQGTKWNCIETEVR